MGFSPEWMVGYPFRLYQLYYNPTYRVDDPDSPLVKEALTNPKVYDFLTRNGPRSGLGLQSPIENVFHRQKGKKCGPIHQANHS